MKKKLFLLIVLLAIVLLALTYIYKDKDQKKITEKHSNVWSIDNLNFVSLSRNDFNQNLQFVARKAKLDINTSTLTSQNVKLEITNAKGLTKIMAEQALGNHQAERVLFKENVVVSFIPNKIQAVEQKHLLLKTDSLELEQQSLVTQSSFVLAMGINNITGNGLNYSLNDGDLKVSSQIKGIIFDSF